MKFVSTALLVLVLGCDRRDPASAPTAAASRVHGASFAEEECSLASLSGGYGFVRSGTTTAGPFAAVGLSTYDGAGIWITTQSLSRNGAYTFDATASGTYVVNADCSGNLFSDGQEVARFALADRGKQVFILSVTPGETVRGVEKKVALRGCTNASLDGTYGFYRTGTTPFGPLAAVGIATFDGAGTTTANQTIVRNGTIRPPVPINERYEVNADCTGRLITTATGLDFARVVVVERGKEIFMLSLSPGNAVTGVQRKVDRGHDEDSQD